MEEFELDKFQDRDEDYDQDRGEESPLMSPDNEQEDLPATSSTPARIMRNNDARKDFYNFFA